NQKISINKKNFFDIGFRYYLLNNFDLDKDKKLNKKELKNIVELKCYKKRKSKHKNSTKKLYLKVSSLKGINKLPYLKKLTCYNCGLKSIDVSKNLELTELNCFDNKITKINLKNNKKLKKLILKKNMITSLDLDNCENLNYLDCSYNKLVDLNLNNKSKIKYFYFNGNNLNKKGKGILINSNNFPDSGFRKYLKYNYDTNKDGRLNDFEIKYITKINCYNDSDERAENDSTKDEVVFEKHTLKGIEYLTNLKILSCSYDYLTELDISKNINLVGLYCLGNNLRELDISKNINLKELNVEINELESIDISNNIKLESILCQGNNIKEFKIGNNFNLVIANCSSNQIEKLDISNCIRLNELNCHDNKIKKLDISKNQCLITFFKDDDVFVKTSKNNIIKP
ncbi:MAG: hypothetical protein ABF289_04065, partial [Clostridiales bacterium]